MQDLKSLYAIRKSLVEEKIALFDVLFGERLDDEKKAELLHDLSAICLSEAKNIKESYNVAVFLKHTVAKNGNAHTQYGARELNFLHISLIDSIDIFARHLLKQEQANTGLAQVYSFLSKKRVNAGDKKIRKGIKKCLDIENINRLLEGTYLRNNFTNKYSFNELTSIYSTYQSLSEGIDSLLKSPAGRSLQGSVALRDYVKTHMPGLYRDDNHINVYSRAVSTIHRAMKLDISVAFDMRDFWIKELELVGRYDHLINS